MPVQAPPTFTNGTLVTQTQLNQVRDGINNLIAGVGARVYHNTNQSIANAVGTALVFDTERYDTDGFHSTSINTGRLTIPSGLALNGYYMIGLTVEWAANATGIRQAYLRVNGATAIVIDGRTAASASVETNQSVAVPYLLNATDYVEAFVYQNSGGALNVLAAPARSAEFWIHRL